MAAGCAKVYAEKVSGARTDRIELAKAMRRIEADDMLIVTRLDRLARSTRDLLNILHQLAEKGTKFKSLADPWCDTSTPQGELLVTVLAGFATFERHLIKARPTMVGSAPRPAGCVLAAPRSYLRTSARRRRSGWPMGRRWYT
jgi:DNA invertase Pin-like site-specific DNA recombinase